MRILDEAQGSSEARNVAVFNIRLVSTGAGNDVIRQETYYTKVFSKKASLVAIQAGDWRTSWLASF